MRELKPEEFTFCDDSTRHNFDSTDTDVDLRVDLYASDPVAVTLVTRCGPIPFWHGTVGHIRERIRGLMRVSIECKKSTKVAVRVATRALRGDVLDYTPVALVPPRVNEIALQQMVANAINRRLGEEHEPFDITHPDEQDFALDGEDDDFGAGYMLTDEELYPKEVPIPDETLSDENSGVKGLEAPSEASEAEAPEVAEN